MVISGSRSSLRSRHVDGVGGFAAIVQRNIKRLMAYSSIGQCRLRPARPRRRRSSEGVRRSDLSRHLSVHDRRRLRRHLIALSIVGVLTSVVSAFYYLRIIKVMYFDEPADGLDRSISAPVALVMGVATLAILLFNLVPAGLFSSATTAAASLFGG
jgi:formate hydrogenlyase subunit 3/multisubunit Na+/H+ antiporter MnhD subunit